MKSERNEINKTIETSCQDCLFAIYDKNTQVGCEFNRLENVTLIEAYNELGNFFVVDGLCNLKRNQSWNKGIADKEKLKAEVSLSFLVLIDTSSMSSIDIKRININYEGKHTIKIFGHPQKEKELLKLRKKLDCEVIVSPYGDYTKHKIIYGNLNSYTVILDKSTVLDLSKFNEKYRLKSTKPYYTEFNGVAYASSLAYNYLSFDNGVLSFTKNMEELKEYAKNYS